MKNVYFSRPPTPRSIYVQNFPNPLDLGRPILNEPSPHHHHPLQQTMEQQPHRACERRKSKQNHCSI